MGLKLFRVSEERGSKLDQAVQDACRMKKCLGSLRYLWRNSKRRSHHDAVAEMKAYLVESPVQLANRVEEGEDEGREMAVSADEREGGEDAAPLADVPPDPEESSDDDQGCPEPASGLGGGEVVERNDSQDRVSRKPSLDMGDADEEWESEDSVLCFVCLAAPGFHVAV